MEKEFIPYEQALALKDLGFDEPCFGSYQLIENRDYENGLKISHIMGLNTLNGIRNHNYRDEITNAPTFSQAFRWFRDRYNLKGFIGFRPNVKKFDCHIYDMALSGKEYVKQRTMEEFNKDPKVGTYEEAELECLKKLIEAVKNKQE